jgi:hypothetical protein
VLEATDRSSQPAVERLSRRGLRHSVSVCDRSGGETAIWPSCHENEPLMLNTGLGSTGFICVE